MRRSFFEHGSGIQRIGGRYYKCLYRAYTDATFSSKAPTQAKWDHLGFLGPAIHAEVGDSLTVVFKNLCTKDVSINVPAVLKPKEHEGWHYGNGSTPVGSGVVPPGGTHTYEWKVVDGPGPLDASSIGFLYVSHQPMHTDTNSGLVGPLIITAFGAANDDGEPLDVEQEIVILTSVTNEGESYLLDKNIDHFIGSMSEQEKEQLLADGNFEESNLMHGVNGFLYGNFPSPQLIAGKKTRVYGMAVGAEADMHSLRIAGHSLLIRQERRAELSLMPGDVLEADILPTAGTWAIYCHTNDHIAAGMIGRIEVNESSLDDPLRVMASSTTTRRYYLQAEEVVWDYGATAYDNTGQYAYVHGNYTQARGPTPFEHGDGFTFMVNDPEENRIGREYIKCIFVGYDATFTTREDRSEGTKAQHLGVLGPMLHAEEGDTLEVELRNKCTIPVSLHAQIVRTSKQDEGFDYQNADGSPSGSSGGVVQPNGSHTYAWHVLEGPGPRDGSSIGTLYYSMASGMVADTYSGLKGPLVITRRGFANADGSPRDVAKEFALVFEVTDEGSSLFLERNFEKFVQERRSVRLTQDEVAELFEDADFQESNRMHGINGMVYANLRGLEAEAETQIRWYLLGLGTEVDLHSVHWHGHTVRFGGHTVDVIQAMPATGVTVDMYADNIGKWLLHCHVNNHFEGGQVASYEIVANPVRGEGQISTCQQMFASAADEKMSAFAYDESWFEGHPFQKEISPFFRVAYTVNYAEMYFDMVMVARTTGWIGLGFFGFEEEKSHAMIDTDMIVAWVQNGSVEVEDRFAQGLETPKHDTTVGGKDQLFNKEGQEANGVTYVKFRRSFKPEHLDAYDFKFRADMEQIKVVYAFSSIGSDNLVYHGPTRGYSQIPWNTNCSSNFFFNLGTSECEGCDRGHFRLPWDPTSSLSRCSRCELGTLADVRGEDRTMVECEKCGFAHATTIYPGATSISECVCEEGYFVPCRGEECRTDRNTRVDMHDESRAFCEPCPTGMACKGGVEDMEALHLKHAQPSVPYGYYASVEDLEVFRCWEYPGRCPGGSVGICAPGRTGIQCAKCEPGLRPAEKNTCAPCKGTDMVPAVLAVVAMLVVITAVYYVIENQDRSKQTHSMLLVTISGTQVFTLIQMLGAVSMVSVDWPDHLARVLGMFRLFVLDIEILNIDCVIDLSPSAMFASKILLLVLVLLIISLIHAGFVMFKYGGRFRERRSSLIGAIGTVCMMFFISAVSIVIAPLHCIDHPSGLWTVRVYQTVVCWEGGEHATMIILALFGILLPIAFLALNVWAVRVYPQRMRNGDIRFLKVVGFLIIRFKAEAYWFSVFFFVRNMFISVIPVVPDVVMQTMLTQLILITSLCLTMVQRPWRVWQANVLDCGVVIAVLLLINLAAFYADSSDPHILAWLCICIIIGLMLTFPSLVAYGLYMKLMPEKKKRFRFFVCHQKAVAGCFSRLLKCMLEDHGHGRTFIDCDDLVDLDGLFDIVGQQTDTLIIVCTKGIVVRPWCVGEICSARTNNRSVLKVIMPGFNFPDDTWIARYNQQVPDFSALTAFGITLDYIQETFRWLRTCPSVIMPPNITHQTLKALTAGLGQKSVTDEMQMPDEHDGVPDTRVFIAVDHTNVEAICTGHILNMLMKPFYASDPDSMPHVLPRGADFPQHGWMCLLICTVSCLQRLDMLRVIWSVSAAGASFVPILADEKFRFPAEGTFLNENRAAMDLAAASAEDLQTIILGVFREICPLFQPMMASEAILNTNAAAIRERINKSLQAPAPKGAALKKGPEPRRKFSTISYGSTGSRSQVPPEAARSKSTEKDHAIGTF